MMTRVQDPLCAIQVTMTKNPFLKPTRRNFLAGTAAMIGATRGTPLRNSETENPTRFLLATTATYTPYGLITVFGAERARTSAPAGQMHKGRWMTLPKGR